MLGCRLWAWEEGPAHLCVTLLREGVEAPGDPHGAGVKAAPRLEALVTVTPGKPQRFLEHRRGLQGDPGSDPHLPPHPPRPSGTGSGHPLSHSHSMKSKAYPSHV